MSHNYSETPLLNPNKHFEGLLHNSGYCSGLKRIISNMLHFEANNIPFDRCYFSLTNESYSTPEEKNAFNYIFKNNVYDDSFSKFNGACKFRYLNTSIGNTPTEHHKKEAHRLIKKYFIYKEDIEKILYLKKIEFLNCTRDIKVISVGYRGTDKKRECQIGTYDKFWSAMDAHKNCMFFIMSDEQEFITETSKKFNCYAIDCNRSNKNGPPIFLNNSIDKKKHVIDMFCEIEIAALQKEFISNYSNIFDYVSFINTTITRTIVSK
jgi:hypothetical protein